MIGRGRHRSHSKRGSTEHGHGHIHNHSRGNSAPYKGLCVNLGNNVFNYRYMASADQRRIFLEKLVQHVGTKVWQDIINKLHNKTIVNINATMHSHKVMVMHTTW